ncbi:ImmA/IrrE family metallo-endopeptidase [Isoalcanivorax indicus]|uniref:ImmA/IrrE family metallo-endopeptidase n=1 Tax=Isoalcanivorax indicus TaxID=2202653 RepID=UPI000DB932F0|nr:ImmA/IrrE family metallo-endopeptidase [Isoalcanivorax indicus]
MTENAERPYSEARRLHKELWSRRFELLGSEPSSPIELLEPELVCQVLGVRYLELPDIPNHFPGSNPKFQIAGLLDRQAGKIAVSAEFPLKTMRFTAMHEVGHWCMHEQNVMHRDRAVDGDVLVRPQRNHMEREADKFAAFFLIPENLLRNAFQHTFGVVAPIRFCNNLAYALKPEDPEALLYCDADSLQRELAIARCESLGNRRFVSLADQFKVSVNAMAIRLKETGLVAWP